jgi:starch-binding outer membrane protein, SusD/RagB family
MRLPTVKHLRIAILMGATLGSISCTDLSENPYTAITDVNFNPTAADLPLLMAPAYAPLRVSWMSWYGMVDWQEETADAFLTPERPNGWDDGQIYYQNHQHNWTPMGPGMATGQWGTLYNGILHSNRVMYQLEQDIIPVDAATKAATIAELRGLRAYYYSLLLDLFGNVPIVTDYTDQTVPEQKTRAEVFDFVTKEFEAVIPSLSTTTGYPGMYGRMNQFAAKGLLARVYLNAQVYTGTQQWEKVLTLTNEIISSGKFQLDANYRGPFARNNHLSPEIIFAVPYDAVNGNQSNFHMKTLKPDLRFALGLTTGPWGGSAGNPQFINTYDPDDGRLADTWLMGDVYEPTNSGRCPTSQIPGRCGYTFQKHVSGMRHDKPNRIVQFYEGFPVRKYEIYNGQTGASDVDYPAVRYADILMMRAEAFLRTGRAGEAATLVTQVRQRNFKGAAAAKAVVTAADLTQGSRYNYGWYDVDGVVKSGPGGSPTVNGGADIQYGRFLDELGWEFAIEGQRRQQLIRFGVFTTKTWFNHKPNGDHRILFAIPQNRLDTNNKLKQNPGY